jgi:phage terminase large subunit
MQEILYTPVFEANKAAYQSHQYRVIANQGSTRSSKTYSICQLLPVIAMQETKSISVVSPSLPHLKKGARRDFLEILMNWGLYNDANFNMTDNIYEFPNTGSYIEFFGADDAGKVRGPGRDILYCNEANLLKYGTYKQLALRTKGTIFIDFNPADEYSWVYDVADKPGNKLIRSTYLNNKANLTKEQINEIEELKDGDENLWKVYGLGLRGTSSETIYTHWKVCEHWPEVDDFCYGLDFGFNHPSVLIKVGFKENDCYWDEEIYESKMTTDDLIYLMKVAGVPKRKAIYCDHSRPETIEELVRAGFNALPADKSVKDGINTVKAKRLFITQRSVNTIKEIKSYKWKKDKNDIVLDEPVKFKDDAMDAGRYGEHTYLSTPKQVWYEEDMTFDEL